MSYRQGFPAEIAADILVNMRQVRKHNFELTKTNSPVTALIDRKVVSLEYAKSGLLSDYDFNLLLDILGSQPDTQLLKIDTIQPVRDVDATYRLTLNNKPRELIVFENVADLKRYSLATT